MKKCRNLKEIAIMPVKNPVAKYAHQFNTAKTFADKSKYRRKAKHAKQEAFPITFPGVTGNASCWYCSISPVVRDGVFVRAPVTRSKG